MMPYHMTLSGYVENAFYLWVVGKLGEQSSSEVKGFHCMYGTGNGPFDVCIEVVLIKHPL